MGTIIPLHTPPHKLPVDSTFLPSSLSATPEPGGENHLLPAGHASSPTIQKFQEELLQFMDESYMRNRCSMAVSEHLNLDERTEEKIFSEVDHLAELIVFSPEIQKEGFAKSDSREKQCTNREWGDVFLKIGDEYPFLFTMYTHEYVLKQVRLYGEKIMPSSRDIILKLKQLGPRDIIRAVIKWANLYAPRVMGRPISLEDPAILQTLVCDPGIEIVCPIPAGPEEA